MLYVYIYIYLYIQIKIQNGLLLILDQAGCKFLLQSWTIHAGAFQAFTLTPWVDTYSLHQKPSKPLEVRKIIDSKKCFFGKGIC